jgi:hypothetical protein
MSRLRGTKTASTPGLCERLAELQLTSYEGTEAMALGHRCSSHKATWSPCRSRRADGARGDVVLELQGARVGNVEVRWR